MSLTQTVTGAARGVLRSPLLAALASPHGVDHYLELVNPLWSTSGVRARVTGVRRETDDVATLTLAPTSGWQGHRAGQFVQVGVEVDGARRTRCFSISSAETDRPGPFTITVRAQDEGLVSRYLVHRARPGTVVQLAQAEGTFTLPDRLPDRLLMVSGGSGITPLMSMLRTLVARDYDGRVTFWHSARDAGSTIFTEELAALARHRSVDLRVVHTRAGGHRFDTGTLAELVPDHAGVDAFACGPAGLVERVREAYGDSDRLRVEYFKVATLAGAGQAGGTVSFDRSGALAENTGDTLLAQAEALGLSPAYGCRMGICFSCTARKREGAVRNVVTGRTSALPDEDVQVCVTAPLGDCVVDL